MNNTHNLKTWTEYFNKIDFGEKKFEIRYNDRGFKVGDILILQEYDKFKSVFTGEVRAFKVDYITDYNQKEGYVVMSISPIAKEEECECVNWCSEDVISVILTGHHENCVNKKISEREGFLNLLRELIRGIECWAADEDGIHPDCWKVYSNVKILLGEKIKEENTARTREELKNAIKEAIKEKFEHVFVLDGYETNIHVKVISEDFSGGKEDTEIIWSLIQKANLTVEEERLISLILPIDPKSL